MAAPARDLIVNLVGKTNQLMGPLQGASGQLTQLGGTLTRTLTPAAAALGAGMALAGREFNSGVDAIRVGTGATGDALSEMTTQMKNLSTDSSLAGIGVSRVGEILADVSTTTGATGSDLEALTERFAQLERMGIGADVQNVARVFGDWGIATEDQAEKMDQLFLAAQTSGASIDDLSTKVVQFGAPLRNLGFGFEESTAMIASFEKNGVNLETVMGGLRQGIGKMAKAGEDVPETFKRVVAEIENTEDASEATRLAIELFGQRSGPDLADAIQNGQFAVEDMLGAIESGSDTIDDAAKDTTRLGDKMAALKNRLVGAIGPFGEIGAAAGGMLAALGPVMMGMGTLGPLIGTVTGAFKTLTIAMMTNPFVLIAAALIAIGVLIFFHRDKVLGALVAAWEWVKETTSDVWNAIKKFFADWWPLILGIMTGGVGLIIALVVQNWDTIVRVTSDTISTVVRFFRDLPGNILSAIGNVAKTLWTKGTELVQGLLTAVVLKYFDVLDWFRSLPGKLVGAIGDAGRILFDIGKDILNGLWNGLKEKWEDVKAWVGGLGGAIQNLKGPIEKDRKLLIPEGRAIMDSLADGMSSGFRSQVTPLLGRITDDIGSTSFSRAAGRFGRGSGVGPIHVQVVMPNGRVLAEVVAEANQTTFGAR